MADTEILEKRTEDIKKVFNNPATLAIIIIIACALLIRIYFLYQTPSQPLWWDEAEYLSTAKHWAFGVPYDINPQRPPLFQAIAAVFFALGLGEMSIRIFLVILPSVFLVYAFYLLGKEMYNKKTGLIAAFLAASSWTFLFWTNRVQPDFFSMSFQILSVLYIWKYWKTEKNKLAAYAGIFAALGFYFKISALLVPLSFMVFIALKDRLAGFKMKGHWYFAVAFIATLIPYLIWSQVSFGDPLAFRTGYSNAVTSTTPLPFAWNTFSFFYIVTTGLLFVLFIIGLAAALKFFLYLDVLSKEKKRCFDPDLFSIIVFIVVGAFYMFYIRGVEDRWVFLWLPFIFFLAAKPLNWIYHKMSGKQVFAGLAIVLLILGYCAYSQITQASSLVESKKDSYIPVKEAALWIKNHSNKGDVVFSVSYTQTVYYSERNVTTYSRSPQFTNLSQMDEFVREYRPRYLTVSVFEQHPPITNAWINASQNKLIPVLACNVDSCDKFTTQKQIGLIVYEVNESMF